MKRQDGRIRVLVADDMGDSQAVPWKCYSEVSSGA